MALVRAESILTVSRRRACQRSLANCPSLSQTGAQPVLTWRRQLCVSSSQVLERRLGSHRSCEAANFTPAAQTRQHRRFGSRVPIPAGTKLSEIDAMDLFPGRHRSEPVKAPTSVVVAPDFVSIETPAKQVLRAAKDAKAHIGAAPISRFGEAVKGGIAHIIEVALEKAGMTVPRKIMEKSAAEGVRGSSGPAPTVRIEGVENVLYLDDSGSMEGDALGEARCILARMAKDIGTAPTRIVKFGFEPKVLTTRVSGRDVGAALKEGLEAWDATSGGTYMWKMIENDISGQYVPDQGRLRVFIITDGMDEQSYPYRYRGMDGMDPMMRVLRRRGFDIEFYVVLLGRVQKGAEKRYQELAGATGGAFLRLAWREQFDDKSPQALTFLRALSQSTDAANDNAASGRRERQKAYEKQVEASGSRRVRWYTQIEAPGSPGSKQASLK